MFLISCMLSGCIDNDTELTKKYYVAKDNSIFTLYSDNTFYYHNAPDNIGFSGVYRINNNELFLIFPSGSTEHLLKDNNVWIDKDGWRWELVN